MKHLLKSTMDMVKSDLEYTGEAPGKDEWLTYARSILGNPDCEDYCLSYREILLCKGIPDNAMLLVAGRLKRGRYKGDMHMVLLVNNQWILDLLERKPIAADRYFSKTMDRQGFISPDGVYWGNTRLWGREEDPRWPYPIVTNTTA